MPLKQCSQCGGSGQVGCVWRVSDPMGVSVTLKLMTAVERAECSGYVWGDVPSPLCRDCFEDALQQVLRDLDNRTPHVSVEAVA